MKTLIRGKSINCSESADNFAILKYANIKTADVDPEKNRLINVDDKRSLISEICGKIKIQRNLNGEMKIQRHENKNGNEIEMTYTIEIGHDLFIGKSTTEGFSKAEKGREQRRMKLLAEEKAKNEAENKLFNNFFGVDGIEEFTVDELGRPVGTN